MASHFSALKRARQTTKRTAHNRTQSSALRTVIRSFRESLTGKDKAAATKHYAETVSAIDKASRKGVIHRNAAARYKSRLAARLKAMA